MNRVLVSGASGPIGAALITSFERDSAQVVRLVRREVRGPGQIAWNPVGELSPEAVSGFDAVIHLAGESVVCRWTAAKKKAIRESRVLGTRNLARALLRAEKKPKVLVCASAIGFYGNRGEESLTEESTSGNGFLAEVCREWEAEGRAATGAGIRTVNIRIGLVLSAHRGALGKMLPAFKAGLGGRLGSGMQWWSWIHVDDIVGAVHHAIKRDDLRGPVNLVGPQPVRNAEFAKTLGAALGRPTFLPAPAFAMRLALGEAAEELMLASQKVTPEKLLKSGYQFRFGELKKALEELV